MGTTLMAGAATLGATQTSFAQPAKSGPWKIGIYTRPWDKHDYRVALDAIKEAGFEYAGLMTTKAPPNNLVISCQTTPDEAHAVAEEVKKRGLKVPSVYGGGIPSDQSVQAGVEGLKRLIDNCATVGAENLMMGGVGEEKSYEPYYKAIAECCPYAEEKGIGISVKPHGGSNSTGPQCRKTIEFVGHKNFGIWYDPGNIFYYSDGALNPIDDAAAVDGLVVGMCVKDFRKATDDKHPKEVMITPGTGQVDFPKVLARLKQGGFTSGALVIECLTQGELPFMLGEAKKAREFVERLVAELK